MIADRRKSELRKVLEGTRRKTLWLLEHVPEDFLKVRVHSFYSPIGWHFGHVGRTEEYWVLHKALGKPVIDDHLSFLFADLAENPKDNRVNLPSREQILEYLDTTPEADARRVGPRQSRQRRCFFCRRLRVALRHTTRMSASGDHM